MSHALIGLGSNVGGRRQTLDRAVQMLANSAGVESVRSSTWHETQPIGGPADQTEYLNGAVLVLTLLSPQQLLARLLEIESALGRQRQERWAPRTLDLDLLLYDNVVLRLSSLQLPHPRMTFRRFVLEPAAEIAGSMVHPTIGWTVSQLYEHLRSAVPYVAISGSESRATHDLAAAVAKKIGWRLIEFPSASVELFIGDSPSLTSRRTIEFLREEAGLISRDRWQLDSEGAISSFWIEDLLAIGDVLWPGALDADWRQISSSVVPPKLLVLYESADFGTNDVANGQRQREAQMFRQRLIAARDMRTQRRGIGPLLRLMTDDPATAEAELVGAIQAMS